MKSQTRKRILEAYDEAFRLLGLPNFTSGIKYICGELQKHRNQLKGARTKHGLEATLSRTPEPNPDELEALIGSIRLVPYQFRKAVLEAAKTLPKPPGGRPRVLTPEDGKEICAQIGALLGQGLTLSNAVRKMAQNRQVSEITIRRIWQKRGKPTTQVEFAGAKPSGDGPTR